jgi:2-dehydro-3-deoxygluconokinase
VLPGKAEGSFLFGTADNSEIAGCCRQLGAHTVVVKLGEKGAYYETEQVNGFVAPFHVSRVVDPIGAGDGFAAGLLSGLLDELPLNEAVKRACAIGALVTQVHGDIEGLPTRSKLDAYMESTDRDDVDR